MKNKQGVQVAIRLFWVQLLATLVVSVIGLAMINKQASLSIIIGGLISILPNAYFARMLFRYSGAIVAQKIVKSFYQGEAMKLLLTFSLFALVFKTFNVVPLAFMVGFMVAQLMFWFAPLIVDNKQK